MYIDSTLGLTCTPLGEHKTIYPDISSYCVVSTSAVTSSPLLSELVGQAMPHLEGQYISVCGIYQGTIRV